MTPMMQQYQEAKERHPGMLLLFRMGDFYELFDSDAETAARVLGLSHQRVHQLSQEKAVRDQRGSSS